MRVERGQGSGGHGDDRVGEWEEGECGSGLS